MSSPPLSQNSVLYKPLAEADPEVFKLIQNETYRQFSGLELIASENLTSLAVMECNGSCECVPVPVSVSFDVTVLCIPWRTSPPLLQSHSLGARTTDGHVALSPPPPPPLSTRLAHLAPKNSRYS